MFIAALTFLCQSCSYQSDWEKTQRVTPVVNRVLNSQCFSSQLKDLGVAPRWISAITTAKRTVPVRYVWEDTLSVGYTYPDTDNHIYLNKKFHDGFSACQTGSNLAHEVLHLEGFRHAYVALDGRQDQLFFPFVWDDAYKINTAFESCCFQFTE